MSDQEQFNKMNWPQNIVDKFWSKVNYPGNDQDCWLWIGVKDKDGYGIFNNVRAPRFSWEYYNGQIPNKLLVMHSCDTPPCVNPNHLSIGTHKNNKDDSVNKNRHAKGSSIGLSKLDESQVETIISKLISREYKTYSDILKDYPNLTNKIIYNILTGACWKHITKDIDSEILDNIRQYLRMNAAKEVSRFGESNNLSGTEDQIIKYMLDNIHNNTFTSIKQICETLEITKEVVSNVLNNRSWKHISQYYNLKELKNKVIINHKLTEKEVRDIKIRLSQGETAYSIAQTSNSSMGAIYSIRAGKIWNHVKI